MRIESYQKLIVNLKKAHTWLNALIYNPELTTSIIADQDNKSERSVRMILSLSFVALDIIEAALMSRLPRGSHTSQFADGTICVTHRAWTAGGGPSQTDQLNYIIAKLA